MSLPTPHFEVVTPAEAQRRKPARRERRDWKPVVDALTGGRTIFLLDKDLTEANVKYLSLALYRRGKGERLRTERITRKTGTGRMLWVDSPAKATTPAVSA